MPVSSSKDASVSGAKKSDQIKEVEDFFVLVLLAQLSMSPTRIRATATDRKRCPYAERRQAKSVPPGQCLPSLFNGDERRPHVRTT